MKTSRFRAYPAPLRRAIGEGVAHLCADLGEFMPLAGGQVKAWMLYLAQSDDPADYYLRRAGLPMFLFPHFLERSLGTRPDAEFLADRVRSTLSGFYYIRLLDDVTDHHAPNETELLPALGFFHTEFQSPYQKHFAGDHSFWGYWRRVWFHSADVTLHDLRMSRVNRRDFARVAAHKTCAVKIPIAAVAYRCGREDVLPAWSRFVDAYGAWHQMANDLFHWHEDLDLGTGTYFLSEAARRKREQESTDAWVLREGFAWGVEQLEEWKASARARAGSCQSADLMDYIEYRAEQVQRQAREMREGLEVAARLGSWLLS